MMSFTFLGTTGLRACLRSSFCQSLLDQNSYRLILGVIHLRGIYLAAR